MRYYSTLNMEWGTIVVEAQEDGIVSVGLVDSKNSNIEIQENEWTKQAVLQLKEYFARERTEFDLPLKMYGTPFQKKVWEALRTIPYGTCVSYQEICRRIGNEKACQAVGTAVGKNPFFIVVPCHRVIASDGTIGGFSLGLEAKRRLFAIEKIEEVVKKKGNGSRS